MKALRPTLDPLCSCFDGWDICQIAFDKGRSAFAVFSKKYLALLAPFIQRFVVSVFVAAQYEDLVYLVEEELGCDIFYLVSSHFKRVTIVTGASEYLPRPIPA